MAACTCRGWQPPGTLAGYETCILSLREIDQSAIFETVAQTVFDSCIAPFWTWLWRLHQRESCFCCMQPREHAACEDAGLQKHFGFALRAFGRAVENATRPISQFLDGQALHGSDSSI